MLEPALTPVLLLAAGLRVARCGAEGRGCLAWALAKPAIIVAAVVVVALLGSGHHLGLVTIVPIVIVLFVVKGLGRRGGRGRRRRWNSDEW